MYIDELVLERCMQKAWEYQTLTLPNPAVGAAVYDENHEILSLEAHQKAGLPHAEVLALFWAFVALITRENHTQNPQKKERALLALAPLWEKFQREQGEFGDVALADLPTNSAAIHAFLCACHGGRFSGKTLVLTLEPCNHTGKTPPCAKLIATLGLKRVLIAARDEWGESAGGAARLVREARESGHEILVEFFTNPHLLQKAQDLLYPFLAYRESGEFCVFKLASRLNGDYKSGQISGEKSREFTHNQRAVADNIIISGATARTDRPRLDTRYASKIYGSQLPDVGIFTTNPTNIDRSMPLFDQAFNRVVRFYDERDFLMDFAKASQPSTRVQTPQTPGTPHISSTCHAPQTPCIQDLHIQGFHIIEGGFGLFHTLCAIEHFATMPKLMLLHLSATLAAHGFSPMRDIPLSSFSAESITHFTLLHTTQLGEDLLLWLKP